MKKLQQHVFVARNDVRLDESPRGAVLSIRGCKVEGRPGSPGFPVRKVRVALPPQSRPSGVKTEILRRTPLTRQKIFVACIQPPKIPYSTRENLKLVAAAQEMLPDEELYRHALTENQPVGVMGAPMQVGRFTLVTIEFNPVRYNRDGTLELLEHIILTVGYEKDDSLVIRPPLTSRQRYDEYSLVHELVDNPELVRSTPLKRQRLAKAEDLLPAIPSFPVTSVKSRTTPVRVAKKVDYLILTDDSKWNADTMVPVGPAGELVKEFKRLAVHKRSRGYRVHVAKVTDIVGDGYGNFRSGARDLQEVIRNFLKDFVVRKGVDFVLLGGDISIIPARLTCGSAWGRVLKNQPAETKSRSSWKGNYLGMWVDTAYLGDRSHILTNLASGQLIPYDGSGDSDTTTPGWYHTTSDSFTTRTTTRTGWIRVNGPEAQVNSDMVWYTPNNMIPSDMYYSSLYSTLYNRPGRHDWDLLDNGLYAQHSQTDIHLGGCDFSPDVRIGRAPVETSDQAQIFVDKTLTYDKWGENHNSTAYNRFKKMLFVADHWGFHLNIQPQNGNTSPPDNRRYTSNVGGGYSLLHHDGLLKEASGNKLIANFSDTSRTLITYDSEAGPGRGGWYYARSGTDLRPSVYHLNLLIIEYDIPIPTEWIVVYGNVAEISPISYDIDRDETDSSVSQQEELREWMRSNFSRINQVQRLYSDVTDMPSGSLSGAGLKRLTGENLLAELNGGPHFVSLTGHGNSGWVAQLSHDVIDNLTNGEQTFIAIADSCLTNKFDVNDAIGEHLLYHPTGGAVAYIGNSRYSWIGIGDDFRLQFFKTMGAFRNIGALNDSRCLFRTDSSALLYKLWTILEQTLMGDPELCVYRTDRDAYPRFVGNWNTFEMHTSTCQWVRRMASYHKVYFDSVEEGLNLGYDGCAFCLKSHNTG